MGTVRIKICGITRPGDAVHAASSGADAIGLVFYSKSPRFVDNTRAMDIISELPPFISKVGLFVNPDRRAVEAVLNEVQLDLLQFHGDEAAADCGCYPCPYIKAVRMHPDIDLPSVADDYPDAKALLLDTYVEGIAGGTGKQFDWQAIPVNLQRPIILAGGLAPGNVADAIRLVRPYAVDVSSGVETAPGIKDPGQVSEFIRQVKTAEQTLFADVKSETR